MSAAASDCPLSENMAAKGLLPPERARMLRGWVHSGFNVHRSRRVLPGERADLERLAQYTEAY